MRNPCRRSARLLRELDAGGAQLLVRTAAVVGLEYDPSARCALSDELADLLDGRAVVNRRAWKHQTQLEIGLLRERDCEPAHEAEVGVDVDDHSELADIEAERLVLVEYVDEGVGDSLEHGPKLTAAGARRFSVSAL